MYALLLTWVTLGNVHLVTVEHVAVAECKAMAAEALTQPQTRAVLCTMDSGKVATTLAVGECFSYPELNTDTSKTFACNNGSIPKW